MRHSLVRQGEGPTAALKRITEERTEHRRALDRIQRDTATTGTSTSPAKRIGHRSPEGDQRRLRGIPAIGRNVAGCIPGTNPETELLRRAPLH